MKLSFRYHPYPLTNFTKFQPGIYIQHSILQKDRKIDRNPATVPRVNLEDRSSTLRLHCVYNIQTNICSATHRFIAINQLQQEARERCKIIELRISAHAVVALPGRTRSSPLPSRVPLLCRSFAPRDASSSIIDANRPYVRAIIVLRNPSRTQLDEEEF